jgi:hypothetical protein
MQRALKGRKIERTNHPKARCRLQSVYFGIDDLQCVVPSTRGSVRTGEGAPEAEYRSRFSESIREQKRRSSPGAFMATKSPRLHQRAICYHKIDSRTSGEHRDF